MFEYLELIEKDYFGLQFVEHAPTERLVVCQVSVLINVIYSRQGRKTAG